MLELLDSKRGVATGKSLLFEHLLHFLLQGSEPLPLLSDDIFVEVLESLVDAAFYGSFVVLGNFDTFFDLLAEFLKTGVITGLHGPPDALAAEFEISRVLVTGIMALNECDELGTGLVKFDLLPELNFGGDTVLQGCNHVFTFRDLL